MILTEQLKRYLEGIFHRMKSVDENSKVTKTLLQQFRHRSMESPTDSFEQKFRILLDDLRQIRSEKNHFQFIEKQHYHSKQFFKKIFNIQSLIDVDHYHEQYEQSIRYLTELRTTIEQYENHLIHYREQIQEHNQQINIYSNQLDQIQLEENSLRVNIEQLKRQIQFEKRLHAELKSIEINPPVTPRVDLLREFHSEYSNLTSQLTQLQWNIEQTSINLLPLQFELHISHTTVNVNEIHSRSSMESIHPQPAVIIDSSEEKMMQSTLQILPSAIRECTKIQSRKSKECYLSNRMRLE